MAPRKQKVESTAIEFDLEGDLATRTRATMNEAPPTPPENQTAAEAVADTAKKPAPKRTRKPKTAPEGEATASPETGAETPAEKPAPKRTRKPKTAPEGEAAATPETGTETPAEKPAPKRTRKPKAAPEGEGTASPETRTETPHAPPSAHLPAETASGHEVVATGGVPIHFPENEKTALWNRIVALLVLVAVIVASVLIFRFRPMSYAERTYSIQFFYDPTENATVIAVNGAKRGEVPGALLASSYDENGEVCAALIGNSLYVVDGRDVVSLASDVSDFTLSAKGEAVAYRVGNDLYYAQVGKDDPAARVTGAAITDEYCLSPDGDHLFFAYEKNGGKQVDIYPSSEKNPYLAETANLSPIGIADNCRYLYYTDADGKLYVLKGKSEERVLCAEDPVLETLIFNRDLSEVMLQNGDTTLLFVDAERVILPEVSAGQSLSLVANQRVTVRALRQGTQYMMSTLLDNYYFQTRGTGIMLAYLDDDGRLSDVSFVEDTAAVTVTDKSVFFLQNEKQNEETRTHLYRCKTGKTEKEALLWDVGTYCANVDGSRILYTNQHGSLFSCRIGSTSEHLCDSIVEGSIAVTVDDTFYFYRTEGELWVSDNGEAPRMIRSGVKEFLLDAHTAYYLADCDENGYGTIFTNHRNQRKDSELDKGFLSVR